MPIIGHSTQIRHFIEDDSQALAAAEALGTYLQGRTRGHGMACVCELCQAAKDIADATFSLVLWFDQ